MWLTVGVAMAQLPSGTSVVEGFSKSLIWTPVSGSARDLSIGTDGTVFALDTSGQVWLRRPVEVSSSGSNTLGPGGIWVRLPGKFVRIAAEQERLAWALDERGELFLWRGTWWRPMGAQFPVLAIDVGVAPGGKAFAVTRNGNLVGLDTRRGMTDLSALAGAPRNIQRVDVDDQGRPWVLNQEGKVYRLDGRSWRALESSPALELSVGGLSKGGAWLIGLDGELLLLAADGAKSQRIAAGAAIVASGPNGKPWIATADGSLYANEPQTLKPERLREPVATQVFTQLFNWQRVTGSATQLAISAKGAVLALSEQGEVWNWRSKNNWGILPGKFKQVALDSGGVPWAIDAQSNILRYQGNYWQTLPGKARLIAADVDGSVWTLNGDEQLAKFNPAKQTWEVQDINPPAGIKRFALDAEHLPWIIDAEEKVQRFDGKSWTRFPEIAAADLALGPDGTAFVVDTEQSLWRWDRLGKRWERLNGAASAVAAGPRGIPWVIRTGGQIFASGFFDEMPDSQVATVSLAMANATKASTQNRTSSFGPQVVGTAAAGGGALQGNSNEALVFQKLAGAPRELAIGADGSVFAVNFDSALLRWNNGQNKFLGFPGQFTRIAVAPDGKPWGVTSKGEVFRHDGTDWRLVYNITASDVAVSYNGTVMVIGPQNYLYKFNNALEQPRFDRLSGPNENTAPPGGVRLALDPNGVPWVIQSDGYVARCDKLICTRLAVRARDIGIGPEGSVFIVDSSKTLSRWNERSQSFDRLVTIADPVDQVAVGPLGKPWVINSKFEVWSSAFFTRDESKDITTSATSSGNTTSSSTSPVFTFSSTLQFDAVAYNASQFPFSPIGIAASPTGKVLVLNDIGQGTEILSYDATLRRLTSSAIPLPDPQSNVIDGIALGRDETLWAWVNPIAQAINGRIWLRKNNAWQEISGVTDMSNTVVEPGLPNTRWLDLAAAADGRVMVAGPDTGAAPSTNSTLFRYSPTSNVFVKEVIQFAGDESAIALDPAGSTWLVSYPTGLDTRRRVYQFANNSFTERLLPSGMTPCNKLYTDVPRPTISGCIGAGANGAIFLLGVEPPGPLARTLLRWNAASTQWDKIVTSPKFAEIKYVAVASDGRPWIIADPGDGNFRVYKAR